MIHALNISGELRAEKPAQKRHQCLKSTEKQGNHKRVVPVDFSHTPFIRVGSITRKLADFPEKERKIWRKSGKPYELEIAKDNLSAADVIRLLSTETYFDLMKILYCVCIVH